MFYLCPGYYVSRLMKPAAERALSFLSPSRCRSPPRPRGFFFGRTPPQTAMPQRPYLTFTQPQRAGLPAAQQPTRQRPKNESPADAATSPGFDSTQTVKTFTSENPSTPTAEVSTLVDAMPGLLAVAFNSWAPRDPGSLLPDALERLGEDDPRRLAGQRLINLHRPAEAALGGREEALQVLIEGRADLARKLILLSGATPAAADLRLVDQLAGFGQLDDLAGEVSPGGVDRADASQRRLLLARLLAPLHSPRSLDVFVQKGGAQ